MFASVVRVRSHLFLFHKTPGAEMLKDIVRYMQVGEKWRKCETSLTSGGGSFVFRVTCVFGRGILTMFLAAVCHLSLS